MKGKRIIELESRDIQQEPAFFQENGDDLLVAAEKDWLREGVHGGIIFDKPKHNQQPVPNSELEAKLKLFSDAPGRSLITTALITQEIKDRLYLREAPEDDQIANFIALNAVQGAFLNSLVFKTVGITVIDGVFQENKNRFINIWKEEDGVVKVSIKQDNIVIDIENDKKNIGPGVSVELAFNITYCLGANPPWNMKITNPKGELIIGDGISAQAMQQIDYNLKGLFKNTGKRTHEPESIYPTDSAGIKELAKTMRGINEKLFAVRKILAASGDLRNIPNNKRRALCDNIQEIVSNIDELSQQDITPLTGVASDSLLCQLNVAAADLAFAAAYLANRIKHYLNANIGQLSVTSNTLEDYIEAYKSAATKYNNAQKYLREEGISLPENLMLQQLNEELLDLKKNAQAVTKLDLSTLIADINEQIKNVSSWMVQLDEQQLNKESLSEETGLKLK